MKRTNGKAAAMAVMTGLVLAVTGALSVDVPQGTDAAEKAEEISHGEAQIRQELFCLHL